MHRFFAPDIADKLTLPEEESRHCVRVLRLVEGDEIEVIDGAGTLFHCRIVMAHVKHCSVEIVSQEACPPHWGSKVMIAVAPTKNLDRIEWMAEKCTEMGVDRITPLLCRHSERKVLKTERLHKILVAAMKQSLKAQMPQIDELTPIEDFLAEESDAQRFIAYCDESLPREERKSLVQVYNPNRDAVVMIGPEGDFDPQEVAEALKAGFVPVTLGESRLRTETAALMAVAMMHVIGIARNG
ncbi:MAG: 16S rRNA (uracil(1498)-N(3))-methyltransferase [Muribaculaceae bacterium]|nr:16S rRNA (uracil(1498)-N(3))-methyltransferase [Muribaculaceae bacterium]